MGAQRISLQLSAAQTAPSNGGDHTIGTANMGVLCLQVTAVSGSSPQMSAWLEVSPDDGTTWFELPAPLTLVGASAAQAQQTGVINKRNINGDTVVSAVGKWVALYPHLPGKLVHLAWNISGTTPSFTFAATMDVK